MTVITKHFAAKVSINYGVKWVDLQGRGSPPPCKSGNFTKKVSNLVRIEPPVRPK